ncbi:MAG TPA: phosphate ABC transporter ATP-binding protein, partial [Porphyromonadaceae bacterium]|nr:phosphate ABC transporter ATP-binding protein [Porphyromonadaceae bacterium]
SDNSMFMFLGELIEYNNTTQMFTKPQHKKTEEYLTGVFG